MKIQVRSILALVGLLYVLNTNLEAVAQTEPQSVLLDEEGFLEMGDRVFEESGSPYDEYFFEGTEDSLVTITLESTDFDTHLVLFDPDGQYLDKNDDIDFNTTNSRLEIVLPADGVYRLLANGLDSNSQGSYTLMVTSAAQNLNSGVENSDIEQLRLQASNDYQRNNYRQAVESYNQVIDSAQGNECDYFYRGNTNYRLGNYEEAIEDFSNSIEYIQNISRAEGNLSYCIKAPRSDELLPENFYNLGNSYYKLEFYDEAVDAYQEAFDSQSHFTYSPNFVEALYNLGLSQSALGNESEAVSVFERIFVLYSTEHELCIPPTDPTEGEFDPESCNSLAFLDSLDSLITTGDITDIMSNPVWSGGGPGKKPASGANYSAARTLYQRGLSASRAKNYSLARSLLTSSANAFKTLGRTQEEAQARNALRRLTR